MEEYGKEFFEVLKKTSYKSAKEIVPIIIELIKPKSVVDVGCGVGSFLKVFMEYRVKDILGIDGDWVNKKNLQIPKKNFLVHDLNKPLSIGKKFDLVISLEVAEHLPEKSSENFIKTLVNLGNVILFSAAIPHQEGSNHLNEQWPDYWAQKFLKHDYIVYDCLRKRIWDNKNIWWWYRQNLILFVNKEYLKKHVNFEKKLIRLNDENSVNLARLVHPEKYLVLGDEYSFLENENKDLRKWAENLQKDNKDLYDRLEVTSSHLNHIINSNSYKLIFFIDSRLKKIPFLWSFSNKILGFLVNDIKKIFK